MATAPPATNRVLTVPNFLSVVRLGCIPIFLWLLFSEQNRLAAGILLAVLGITDWVDGYVARHFDQVSELGKVLDPTADRLLFIVCVGGDHRRRQRAALGFSVLVVVREVLVGGTMVLLTLFGMKRFDVSWFGKAGTFGLMMTFPLFFMGAAGDSGFYELCWVLGWLCGIPSLILSYYAAITYVPIVRRALREGREARHQ